MIKTWIRKLIGIPEMLIEVSNLRIEMFHIKKLIAKLEIQSGALSEGVGRVISRLDPMNSLSEEDMLRQEISERLGKEVMQRLIAEEKARRHTEGEL